MAVEAFVGLVGGGKSYNSVRRMMSYMARGGRCCSNILLTDYDVANGDFLPSSPILPYLRSIGWEYQKGQYTYIPFDVMVADPDWIKRVPAGIDREHRTLLVVDEATDLFDSLDGGRLRVDSRYREIFHFLRLSRHVHVDVLFVVQDINSINTRLRGLVSYIWRSTDMKDFRLAKLKIPFPFNLFMLQQFDRNGKYEVKREWVSKDPRVFTLYRSEAFNNSLSVKWDGVSVDMEKGRQKRSIKKMTKFQMLLLLLAVFLGVYNLFRGGAGSDVVRSSMVSETVTNYVVCVTSNNVCFSGASTTNGVLSSSGVVVKRGPFRYFQSTRTSGPYVLFGNARLASGMPSEFGYVKNVSSEMVSGETFDGSLFYLLPEYLPPSIEHGTVVIHPSGEPRPSRRGPF